MANKPADLIGKRFGRLVGVEYSKIKKKWIFKCDCGNFKDFKSTSPLRGTKSCGCLIKEIRHGNSDHPLYLNAQNQKARCENKAHRDYSDYGGRGIKFNFKSLNEAFLYYLSLGDPPTKKHQLDRLDNEGNYEIGNMGYSTRRQQNLNRRIEKIKTSKFRGVCWSEKKNRWVAQFSNKDFSKFLGHFKSEILAAEKYLEKYFEIYKKWPPEYPNTPLCYKTPLHHLGLIT